MDDIQQTREAEQRFGREALRLLTIGNAVRKAMAECTPDTYAEFLKQNTLSPRAAIKYLALVEAFEAVTMERPYAEGG